MFSAVPPIPVAPYLKRRPCNRARSRRWRKALYREQEAMSFARKLAGQGTYTY